jgi:hypothetical protein
MLREPWTAAKRAAGLLPFGATILTGNWLAVAVAGLVLFLIVLVLVLAVGWLARRTDAGTIETPILTWRRQASPRRQVRRRPWRGSDQEPP